MSEVSIRKATERQSLRIRRDNLSTQDAWILVDVASDRVTLCNQKPGESATGEVHFSRKDFNKFVDWYTRPQKMRKAGAP